MQIQLFKLVNGEELVANTLSENQTHVIIEDPLKLEWMEYGGTRGRMMTYWIPLCDDPISCSILKNHIIISTAVTQDVIDNYRGSLEKIRQPEEEEEDEPEELEELIERYRNVLGKRILH